MLKIAICDDEAVAIAAARQVLLASDLGAESEIASYTDPAALWKDVQAGKRFDLVLLDVDMPELDGIELGVHLGDALPEAVLIYLSGQSERVFDTFRARPFRFLQKDHFPAEWPSLCGQVAEELKRVRAKRLVFLCGQQQVVLRPEEIVYAEALGKKQVLHTLRGNFNLSDSFESVTDRLEEHGFIRLHRSYLVNYRFIYTINRTDVELDDGTYLPIGRSKHPAVQQEFHRLVLLGL